MRRRTSLAIAAAAAGGVALAAVTLPSLAHGSDGMRGARGPVLDFAAVAGGADSVDRERLMEYGIARLGAFDLDGDGRLDRDELAAAMPRREAPGLMVFSRDPAETMADRILARFDAGSEGSVAVEALVRRQVDAIVARYDRDGDGVITAEEAERPMRRAGRWMRHGPRS